jgi:precorrin-8X/cobalt-precorrin-8 methylmutase
MNYITDPSDIEKKSFEIIAETIANRQNGNHGMGLIDPINRNVIMRVIHTTADFDYIENLAFTTNAVANAMTALKNGAKIITDTQMVKSGINKQAVKQLGCDVHCFIDAPEVVETAKTYGYTRARAAVDHAVKALEGPVIFAVGNAPTALIRLYELITEAHLSPTLIIGVPVGFVNVVESKEMIMELGVPYIVAKGRKGGSNVAAAICNALLYDTVGRTLA